MKVALLSDPHLKTKLMEEALDMLKDKGAQYIVHAGDFQIKENLEVLKNMNLPYVSVFGNNDHSLLQYQGDFKIYGEPYYFKIKDISFKLMHLPYYMSGDTDVVIFGHTHIFHHEYKNNTLFLNPGEICAREKDLTECVLLEILEDKYIINFYYKKPEATVWQEKVIEYSK